MRTMKSRFIPVLLVCSSALLLSLSGCGGGGSSSGGNSTVSSITVTPTSASIAAGATQQFTAVAKNANGKTISGVTFTWSSSNSGVATINASGIATGVAAGTTNITASAKGVTSPAAALTVTVPTISSITVAPTSASIATGATQQFTAVAKDANGTTISGVTFTWSSSNTSVATINASGLATGVAVGTTNITASAQGVTSPAATLTVATISSITVAPTSASIAAGATQQFTAVAKDANGKTISGVTFTWSSSNTGVATINASGLATGVAAGTTSITASAKGVTSPAAALTVTTAPPSTPLQGQYAFLVSGYDSAMAGSVTLDGHGNVTGGKEDIVAPGTTNFNGSDLTISSGTYSVGSDDRGILSYTDSKGNSFTFAIAIGDITSGIATQGQMIEFDSNPLEMTGSLALQTAADFSTSALTGAYAFESAGWDSGPDPNVTVGSFTAGSGAISNGLFDQNDAGMVYTAQAFNGSIGSVDSNGRGAVTLMPAGGGSQTVDFYVVSAGKLFLISDASNPGVQSGEVLQQTGGPFSGSSLSGVTVLQVQSGTNMPAPSATLGLVTFGSGSAFSFDFDVNNGGSATGGVSSHTGTGTWSLTSASNGRFLLTPQGSDTIVGYLVAPNQVFLADITGDPSFGTLEPQSGSPFTNASLQGSYFTGTLPWLSAPTPGSPPPAFNIYSGIFTFDGVSTASAVLDVNSSGVPNPDVTGTDTYSVASSGRVTTGSGAFIMYIVSPTKVYALSTSQGQPSSANPVILVLQKQAP